MVSHHRTSRHQLNWFGYSTISATLPLLHFAASVVLWLHWWISTLRNPFLRSRFVEEVSREFTCFAPAACLFLLSLTAWILALKGRLAAWRVLLVVLLGAAAFFSVDIYFHRYQVNVEFATQEYWDNGGHHEVYFTWWWYNDMWFK